MVWTQALPTFWQYLWVKTEQAASKICMEMQRARVAGTTCAWGFRDHPLPGVHWRELLGLTESNSGWRLTAVKGLHGSFRKRQVETKGSQTSPSLQMTTTERRARRLRPGKPLLILGSHGLPLAQAPVIRQKNKHSVFVPGSWRAAPITLAICGEMRASFTC